MTFSSPTSEDFLSKPFKITLSGDEKCDRRLFQLRPAQLSNSATVCIALFVRPRTVKPSPFRLTTPFWKFFAHSSKQAVFPRFSWRCFLQDCCDPSLSAHRVTRATSLQGVAVQSSAPSSQGQSIHVRGPSTGAALGVPPVISGSR